ncbi:MAG TPA: helix-turn-helix domain-containing protein [Pseudonocardia sp.]|jgi:transcriptional regulator of acetoin/glycerol metabolism
MDDWIRTMERARESVLMGEPAPGWRFPIRPVVYESWRRSKLYGLDPFRAAPGEERDVETDSYLVRLTEPVVRAREAALEQTRCALSLIDHEGRVLRRWAPDRTMRDMLDDHRVVPGFSVAEQVVGTTSAVSLLSGAPLLVNGPEHFSERFRALTCGSAPIVHPVTRRTVGSINLTCRYTDSSPLLLAWVTELAGHVREALGAGSARHERALFASYLEHNHDTRHPLVTLDEQTIITNAAAARLLGGVDQGLLWEHARAAMDRAARHGDAGGPTATVLSDGTPVRIECLPVLDGTDQVGAVLKLKAPPPGRGVPTDADTPAPRPLPGLVGTGPSWRALCRVAAELDTGRVLVTGERGVGKLAVARAVAVARAAGRPVHVLDAAAPRAAERWLAELGARLADPGVVLVLRHLEALDGALATGTRAVLDFEPAAEVLATATRVAGEPGTALHDHFDAVLEVPPLRERREDLPALLEAMTARLLAERAATSAGTERAGTTRAGPERAGTQRAGAHRPVRWMPDAVQTLARIDWPGNLASLEACVRRLLGSARCGQLGAADLPADLVARASRRPLARLEQAEARAIMTALREAGGNKHRAAESLGIARSTLYRKVRALGIDLSASVY